MFWTRDDMSYLAGLFDGEGCVYTATHKGGRDGAHWYKKVRMIISNTDKGVIDWLCSQYGGYVQVQKKDNPKHKTGYNWWLEGDKAKQLLMTIYPLCIIKQKAIQKHLNFT